MYMVKTKSTTSTVFYHCLDSVKGPAILLTIAFALLMKKINTVKKKANSILVLPKK